LLSVLMAVGIGAVIGRAVGGIGYALQHPDQSLGEYARNAEFQRAVGIGAASGAVAGLVGWAVPSLFPAAGSFWGAVGLGALTGALTSGAGQVVTNLLTPCTPWNHNLGWAILTGALGGALAGGVGYGIRQWAASARPVNSRGVPYPDVDVPGYGKVPFPKGPYTPNNTQMRTSFHSSYRQQFKSWWIGQGRPWPNALVNIHHIKPLQFGGTNTFDNLIPLEKPIHDLFTNWWRYFQP